MDIPILETMLAPIQLPRFVKIRQSFDASCVANIGFKIRGELERAAIREKLRPGMKIAVTCGSRGIADIHIVIRELVHQLQEMGTEPFVIPAMGSHGGATAEGQREVLAHLGVTEAFIGCPIRATMEVRQVATADNGDPVYADKFAVEADGVILVGRIKPHTDFSSTYESGLVKMMVIGLGKQKGAESCHRLGPEHLPRRIEMFSHFVADHVNILFGLGLVENADYKLCMIQALTKEEIFQEEPKILQYAYRRIAQIPFKKLDVLIVDEIGKEISGGGADPNITGRFPNPITKEIAVQATCCAYLSLTKETNGNACGVGLADITTQRLFDQIDFAKTYPNSITSTLLHPSKIPIVMKNDYDAMRLAIYACRCQDRSKAKIVRIVNTEQLSEMWISEALLLDAKNMANVKILTEAQPMVFDENGNLF